jgi:DNA-binding MarR family transcriptional regulator
VAEFRIEKSVGFLLAKAHQRLYAHFRQELANFSLTPPQFALLAFLWERDGLSQAELSERTEVDRTTLGGLVDRLEKAGLVKRLPNPQDRRAYLIHLTPRGEKLEKTLAPIALRIRERVTEGLEPGEVEKLCELLEKLRG